MTAAEKIAEARALIEPLTGHTPGNWRKHGNGFQVMAVKTLIASATLGPVEANTRLIAASPALRDTVAALADLADAQAQENASLRAALAGLANALELPQQRGVLTLVPEALERARAALGDTP